MTSPPYPPSPAAVPVRLTAPSSTYRRHVWLAVLGLLAFVIAYAALTGWFAYKAVTLMTAAADGGPRAFAMFVAGAVAAFLALFLGKGLFFIRQKADPARVELTEAEEPQLFAFIRRLAAETGARPPYRVYLSPRVNAAVFYDLSLANLLLPSRKNLEIGVGLVNTLNLAEFKAVLAHEFGHFAQRSMAVGRWVYISQQVVAQIVAKRDALDRFLGMISGIDLRIAWVGWIMRLIVWSIRSVLESFFAVIVLAERALSREMELQADLVSVSVTGSDALIHALRKLPAADAAWDTALDVFAAELRAGRRAPDLCALQDRVLGCTRRVLADPLYGEVPPLPEGDRAAHRVFTAELCQPPRMWSTHPPSHLREDNAKRRYVAGELDERPAWVVFGDPAAVRSKLAARVAELIGPPEKVEPLAPDAALAVIDRRYDRPSLDTRYRGAYLGRSVTRHVDRPGALCDALTDDPAAVRAAVDALYPESLSSLVERLREQANAVVQLEAIRRGLADAPGGIIRYGGEQFRRRELPAVLAAAKRDEATTRGQLRDHDRRSRSAHQAAAERLGRGWPQYLAGLRALLHYAEHSEANVDDAAGHLRNVVSVVTADGKVTKGEAERLVVSGRDLWHILHSVYEQGKNVVLPAPVAKRLEIEAWPDALPTNFGLEEPIVEVLGSFMQVVDGWFQAFSGPLGALRMATLDELLAAEAHVADVLRSGADPGDAPAPGRLPKFYSAFCEGAERERQLRLGWWDRFLVADGLGPALARLTIAGSVVGVVVGVGGAVDTPTLVIHNGLGRDLLVTVAERELRIPGHGREELQIPVSPALPVRARTLEGREIEAFSADAGSSAVDYVYNIGGASPLVEWTARYEYGASPKPRVIGAPRWLATDADDILRDPPPTARSATSRRVLSAVSQPSPLATLGPLDVPEGQRVLAFHARWEVADGPDGRWLQWALGLPDARAIAQARADDGDRSVMVGRILQELSEGAEHDEVCRRHEAAAAAAPDDLDAAYLATRCIVDVGARDARFFELHQRHPEHPWLSYASIQIHAARDDFAGAIASARRVAASLPMMADNNAVVLARLERRASPDREPDLDSLARTSPELLYHLSLERGAGPDGEDVTGAYRTLQAGLVGPAVTQADPQARARVLRLAAASDGADPSLVEQLGALGVDEGIDDSTMWTAIAHAAARGADPTPYLAKLGADRRGDDETMRRFSSRERLLADLDGATRAMKTLPLPLRGQAAAMGIILLREQAPDEWRLDARRLLFGDERPYFAPRVERPPPEPPPPAPPAPRGDRRGARKK